MNNLNLIAALILFSHFVSPISAFPRFFPNITSIPKSLIPNTTAGAWDSFQKLAGCHTGQKVDGIAKLKNYFHYFGYISNSTKNFTNEFDEEFESAIKTYQRNFNLNATGELDETTVKQILLPRCGNADVVNGSSTMNSGKFQSSASSIHAHTVAHYTFFPGTPRWPERRRDLTFAFLEANQVTDDVRRVFTRAFARWAQVVPLTFTETTSYLEADIRIAFASGDHGDGEPFDGVLGTLAHAFSPPSGLFHLDGDENWVVDDSILSSRVLSAVDLESVAVHEIGHLLGLGHSSVENAIMFPTISSGTRKVELANDDIEGIQQLYGANPNYNGSSTTTTTTFGERDTNNNSGFLTAPLVGQTLFMAVGLMLLVL